MHPHQKDLEWRQVTIRSRYCKNKKNNSGSKYNIVFSDSNCDKTYLFDLDEVAWTDPEIEINTSKVKLMTKEQPEVLVTTIPYFQHGIPEIEEGKNEKLESSGAFKPVRLNSLSEDQKARGIATTWTEVYKAHANDGKEDLVKVQGEDGAMATLEVPANSPLNGESEAVIATQGKTVHYRHVLKKIFGLDVPGEIVTDNKALREAVQNNNIVKDKGTYINIIDLRSVVEEDDRIVSWLSGVWQPVEIRMKPAVNSRVVKTLMSSEMFRTPMVFMIWLFLMMMVVRFDLQFFSLNAVKERVYDSVNKEVVE